MPGLNVETNFDGFMAECRLHNHWADEDEQDKFQQLERRLAKFGTAKPSTEWEFEMRALHRALEAAWKEAILDSFRDRGRITSYDLDG